MKFKTLIAGAVAAATLVGAAGVAGADGGPAPSGTGWDGVNDLVVGAGSDTTYRFMQEAELLYNQSQGCETDNSSSSPNLGKCKPIQPTTVQVNGNFDHDRMTGKYPTGSGAGRAELTAGTADYARSSSLGSETTLTYFAFAKDGIAIVTNNGRTPANITLTQLTGIYNCSITDWSAITGEAPGNTIEPIGMNPSSGTYATFKSKIGTEPNSACAKKVDLDGPGPAAAFFPQENDWKQVENSVNSGPDVVANINNTVWWFSYGEFRAWSYKRRNAVAWTVNGVSPGSATISNDTYPISRLLYHVAKRADADVAAVPGTENVIGATSGKAGAVREFTEWLCKAQGSHGLNDFTGNSQYIELGNRYTLTGFIRLPVAQRTNGICAVTKP